MSDDNAFADFLCRIRAGDARAAEELVRQHERLIRLEVRMRIGDPRLRRVFDSMDVCQSVLASFFTRAALGQYDLAEPGELLRLLCTMARNKLRSRVRAERRLCRDGRRVEGGVEGVDAAADDPSPSELVADRELLALVRARLSEEELRIADLRMGGKAWAEIAAALGGTAQSRRKQLERALDRVARELGLDEQEEAEDE